MWPSSAGAGDPFGDVGELELEGVDVALDRADVRAPALHTRPLALLDQLDDLQLEPHLVVGEAGIDHGGFVPRRRLLHARASRSNTRLTQANGRSILARWRWH